MLRQKGLITARVLADSLDLSVGTVWKYTRERKIPFIVLGRRQYRYKLDEVTQALTGSMVIEKKTTYRVDHGRKYTYQDYLELPEEPGYRLEVLEGSLVKEPSPNVMHQRVSYRLHRILQDYFRDEDPKGEVFFSPLDVTFFDTTVVQPDLLYISGAQQEIVKEARIDGPPKLVVEIISPSSGSKDRLRKMQIYQRVGIEHYWIADPKEKTLECFALRDGVYARITEGIDDNLVEHPTFKGLSVDLAILWHTDV